LHVFLDPVAILGVTDPEIWDLRCYQDQDIAFSSGVSPACDFVLGSSELIGAPSVTAYPNPGNDMLNVAAPAGSIVKVMDAVGRLIGTWKTGNGVFRCATGQWPCGPFMVVVETSSSRVVVPWFKY